jgi:hypothetical protein
MVQVDLSDYTKPGHPGYELWVLAQTGQHPEAQQQLDMMMAAISQQATQAEPVPAEPRPRSRWYPIVAVALVMLIVVIAAAVTYPW